MAIIRFETQGTPDTRLTRWDDIPASEIESGRPIQRGRTYVDAKECGLTAGEWDCTAFTSTFAPYPVHEFMHVLEGGVEIIEERGISTYIGPGESFVIPKGLKCKWKQTGTMRKFFVIWEDSSGPSPPDPSQLRLVKPDPKARLEPIAGPSDDILLTPSPSQHGLDCNVNATGEWSVGLWGSTPYERKTITFPRHELMHILEGSVMLAEEGGARHRFKAGDTFLVERETRCNWKSTEYVRKIYCSLKPLSSAAQSQAAE